MAYNGKKGNTPTRSLRGEKKPTFTEFPVTHQLVLGVISEVCTAMRDGYYQGKLSSTGGIKVTVYQEDENVTDYFSYLDDPIHWLVLISEACWGAGVTKEALATYAKRAGLTAAEVSERVKAIPR